MSLFLSLASAKERGPKAQAPSDAPRIAVVLAGDQKILSEERIIKEIDRAIEKKFPQSKYRVVQDKKVYQELLVVAEERDIVELNKLKRADFVDAGKKYEYDYIVVLPFYNEGGYYTTSGWTNMVSQNIIVRARIVDVAAEEYLYRFDVLKQGETGNSFGSPSLVRAQKEAIGRCLDEIFSELPIGETYKVK